MARATVEPVGEPLARAQAPLDPTVKALGVVTLLNDLSSEAAVRTPAPRRDGGDLLIRRIRYPARQAGTNTSAATYLAIVCIASLAITA